MTNIEFLNRYELLPEGSHVLCALSGGRDSVYLLHRLLQWSAERNLKISAAHYNHHLRGQESERDEQFVRTLCHQLKIPLSVGGGDVRAYAKSEGLSIETAARQLRYAFLEEARATISADLIATAHHADDLAETMLFHLVRGTGTRGLSGIPPRRGDIVRPILMVTRQEIDEYLQKYGISYVEDSTNRDVEHSRNKIRHQVMPVLRELNPEFVRHAARTALMLREDDSVLQDMADAFLRENPPENGISGNKLLALETPVSTRVIRTVWGEGLSYDHVKQILDLCGKDGLAYAHVSDAVVRYDCGRLWTEVGEQAPAPLYLEGQGGEGIFGPYRISWRQTLYPSEIHNSLNTLYLKYENIKGSVAVSSKKDGDRVKFAGSNCTKSLKKLFSERKFTQPERATIPVLRDEEGIVAVIGFGVAQRCVPEIGDQVISIEYERKREYGR